jgi:hypothetical protein
MTEKELLNFLVTNEIGVGDLLELNYRRLYPEVYCGNVVLKELQFGRKTIKTQFGELNLPEERWYLILHNNNIGAYGVSAQYITKIELLQRRGITPTGYYETITNQNIKNGDLIVIIDVDKKVQLVTILDTTLNKDADGDDYFKVLTPKGAFNCYLQGVTSLRKS